MELLLGPKKAGQFLDQLMLTENGHTKEVFIATCYACGGSATALFEWCVEHYIPFTFYGSTQPGTIAPDVMRKFAEGKYGQNARCRLVNNLHAKVIWFRERGIYIGSANLSDAGWHTNTEAGVYYPQHEINDDMRRQFEEFFIRLEARHIHPKSTNNRDAMISELIDNNLPSRQWINDNDNFQIH